MRAIRHAAAALAVGTALVVAATPAMADSGQISVNTGSGWSHDAKQPLFDFSRIAPGWSSSASLSVRNDGSDQSTLTLMSTDVIEDENGCDHPESYVDSTCSGPNAGELGHELILRVYDRTDSATPIWHGNLYDLDNNPTLDSNVAPGQVDDYRITAELPYSSGNETQTDTVNFSLRLTLDGATGTTSSTSVQGVKITRIPPQHGIVENVLHRLPFTGSPIGRMLAGSLWLLTAGMLLLGVATASRRREAR